MAQVEQVKGMPYNFRWFDKTLAGSSLPDKDFPKFAKDRGITTIFRVLEDREIQYDFLDADYGDLNVIKLPTSDAGFPEPDKMKRFLSNMDKVKAANEKALVHCRLGRGRTSLFAGIWLLHEGKNFVETKSILTDMSQVRNPDGVMFEAFQNDLETDSQRRYLDRFGRSRGAYNEEMIGNDMQKKWLNEFAKSKTEWMIPPIVEHSTAEHPKRKTGLKSINI